MVPLLSTRKDNNWGHRKIKVIGTINFRTFPKIVIMEGNRMQRSLSYSILPVLESYQKIIKHLI